MIARRSIPIVLAFLSLLFGCDAKPETSTAQAAEPPEPKATETIRVAIGTQDTTINCAAGGPIVRELGLLEKYLPRSGKYEKVKYDLQWENQPTGAQLNSKYLANQLDIVQMADFPSVLGATALKAAGDKVESFYIANLSGGINGAGNAIVVPTDSKVQSLAELKVIFKFTYDCHFEGWYWVYATLY